MLEKDELQKQKSFYCEETDFSEFLKKLKKQLNF